MHSGPFEQWWNEAMECCCQLRHIHDARADSKTSEEKLFDVLLSRAPVRSQDASCNIRRVCLTYGGWMDRIFAQSRLGRPGTQ